MVGRYVVLRRLGVGGMGIVYAAYDPELDRKVALKLLLAGAAGSMGRTRLLREAQALAKLSHPNVVAIYDVGSIGDQVWLAMELVHGQTLREWLNAPRGWRDVLEVMRDAGKGLAAAHAAGLLHRDFKPDNVMVGDDGRVRVMDFGLARARPTVDPVKPDESQAIPTLATLAMSVTQSGALVGTPYYMAPEQIGGEGLTHAVDQFAFCLTLWEALYGERPFGGQTPMETFANVLDGRLRPPSKVQAVPTWLRRACERGLSVEPRDRWPSMDALLLELRPYRAPRRWWALGLAAGLAAVGIGLGQYAKVGFRCDGSQAQLDGVWDHARKREVKEAILATGLSYAPDTWERVERGLDEYALAWAGKHTEVCEATSVREEQSTEVMDLRMECLRRRRVELRETVGVLAEADATRVEKAVELVASLPGLSRCDDVEALQAELPPPEDPQVAVHVEALRERLAQARTLREAGAHDAALAEAKAVVEQADALGYPPLLAEALLERSRGATAAGRNAEVENYAEQAYLLAVEHGHHRVEADAASQLVGMLSRPESRLLLGKMTLALAKRGQLEPELEADTLSNIGAALWSQGKFEEALSHLERALVVLEKAVGHHHPGVASLHNDMGPVLKEQGKWEEALSHHQRVLDIYEEILGPRHPQLIRAVHKIGWVLKIQGKDDEALSYFQRGLTISEEAFGLHHPTVADSLAGIGAVLGAQGKEDEAVFHYQRALAILEKEYSSGPRIAWLLSEFGSLLLHQGKPEEARAHLQRALDIFEEEWGPHNLGVGKIHLGLAEVELTGQDPAVAREHAERAVSIYESSELPPYLIANARFIFARALWVDPSKRVDARILAEQVRNDYAEYVGGSGRRLAEMDTWLVEHQLS